MLHLLSGEVPFLRSILAAPDSPDERLVYADWLEEQGDSRGEFLRTFVGAMESMEADRFPAADAFDPWKPERHARFVPGRELRSVKRHLEHKPWRHLTHRTKAVSRVRADPFIELAEFLVRKARIGFADWDQCALLCPGAERVVRIE